MKNDVTLLNTVDRLKEASRDNDAPVWRDLAKRLTGPTRNRTEVNVSTINRHCSDGDVVAVPGKVLGAGTLDASVTVGAFDFSGGALDRIAAAGGRALSLEELVDETPSGSDVRIME